MSWKFQDIIAIPEVRSRWEKVRKFFFLRESTYDMTNRCNVRCDGCYYYEGDKQFAQDNKDPEAWRRLMREEKERGITYVVLAGAEPALVSDLLKVCHDAIPLGSIASNGLKRIAEDIRYKIHVSVWGNDDTSFRVRRAKNMLRRQVRNYHNDPRAVFIYTFTRENIQESKEVVEFLVDNGCNVTFNVFSAPVGYEGSLKHTQESLLETRKAIQDLMRSANGNILYSGYNLSAHTGTVGLHDLFGCSYPRMNPSTAVGLGRSFRQYRSDLTWDRDVACCVPDTDCVDCRHYASGSAIVTARLHRHATSPELFKAWLDYVDTYLAVWVMDYDRDDCFFSTPTQPPVTKGVC